MSLPHIKTRNIAEQKQYSGQHILFQLVFYMTKKGSILYMPLPCTLWPPLEMIPKHEARNRMWEQSNDTLLPQENKTKLVLSVER